MHQQQQHNRGVYAVRGGHGLCTYTRIAAERIHAYERDVMHMWCTLCNGKNAVATPDWKGRDPHMSTALDQRGRAWFT